MCSVRFHPRLLHQPERSAVRSADRGQTVPDQRDSEETAVLQAQSVFGVETVVLRDGHRCGCVVPDIETAHDTENHGGCVRVFQYNIDY